MPTKPVLTPEKIFTLTIVTALTIVCWLIFSLYSNYKKTTINNIEQSQLEPVDPNFDQKTFESLKSRIKVSQQNIDNTPEITKITIENENNVGTPEASLKPLNLETNNEL